MTTNLIIQTIYLVSAMYGVDPNLAVSIAKVESGLNPNAVGTVGEIGLYQVRPEYVTGYTRKELFNPYINIVVGIKKLAEKKKACYHKVDKTWVICYNRGVTGGSRVKEPHNNVYYKKVMRQLSNENKNQLQANRF